MSPRQPLTKIQINARLPDDRPRLPPRGPESHPLGFIQRRKGLHKTLWKIHRYFQRAEIARSPEARFDKALQLAFHEVIPEICTERAVKLHAAATCPTHIHVIYSFKNPACTCGAPKFCRKGCPAKSHTEKVFTRLKQKLGQSAAKLNQTQNRPWLSRGWNTTPIRNREHLNYLLTEYLPKHETEQHGICF